LFPIVSFSQIERWVYRYSGVSGFRHDCANSIIYGSDENLYAAGISWYDATKDDFTVISLTNLGVERWIYTYNGLADNNDEAYFVVYGEDGNIYVAGSCYGTDTTRDFTVISLTSAGTERWVYQYNGSGDGPDYAYAIAYGADGNIYVTGNCWNTNANTDFTVISLTNSGTERWVYQYNGSGDDNDCGRSIVYGADGCIYAGGDSYGIGAYEDFTVISLADSGTERWVYRYNGPGNWADYAFSVVYGSDSNIYATGGSFGSVAFDITVICLTDSGTDQWIYRHPENGFDDCGYAGVYGADSNIYVAGIYGSSIADFMVVSLTDSGTPRWEYVCYTAALIFEQATSIVYGADSNIYAAGQIAPGSITDVNFAVVSLTNSGTERWVYRYDRCGEYDFANSICYGVDGNLYAAGQSIDSITGGDFTVISINPDMGVQEDLIPSHAITYKFLQIHPNPFHNKTVISYFMERDIKNVVLKIYDVTGRLVKSFNHLTNHQLLFNQITWDGTDDFGKKIPTGVYFCRLETDKYTVTKKIVKLR